MIIEPKNKGIDQRLFKAMIKTNEECPYHNMLDMYITELNEESSLLCLFPKSTLINGYCARRCHYITNGYCFRNGR